jgi:hypothetical protein
MVRLQYLAVEKWGGNVYTKRRFVFLLIVRLGANEERDNSM